MISTRIAIWISGSLLVFASIIGDGAAQAPIGAAANPEAKGLFGTAKVWTIDLDLSAAEYEAMQPATPAFPGSQPQHEVKKDKRPAEQNRFGTAFPWAHASVAVNGTKLDKVGIRYAGDITYFVSTLRLKRPLAIKFDLSAGEGGTGETFDGLSSVQLHAMPLDPSKARAALASAMFRAAGVPAPRTAFAEVTLTVADRYNKEFLGLYTVVEGVDRRFLADRLGADSGLLMTPFRMRGIDFLGDDWNNY